MLKKYSPVQITIYWIVVIIILGLISGVIANSNASGGEQKLFTYVAYSIAIALIGAVLINIGTLFFFTTQSKKNRLFSLGFIVVSLILLLPLFKGVVSSQYNVIEKTRYIGSDKIDIKIEYYSSNDTSRIIRSESFWKNGKKDSVWTTYERNGNIIKQKKYNNNQLIETIK
jgi:hypothetical protein